MKTRPQDNPYQTYTNAGWTWAVVKHYQTPDAESRNPYARVLCYVTSPMTSGGASLGDVYCRDIPGYPPIAKVAPGKRTAIDALFGF